MLYIHYNQTKPNEKEFEYAIQGDNNVDVVDFDISDIQLDFEPTHIYAKVQSKDKKYTDKIELTANNNHLLWNLQAKTTRHKIVNVQLSFETAEKCFQTEMVELTLKPYINADQTIANDYPTVLQDLQDQIDDLKEQGGGGSNEVEIKRVYLTYDDEIIIRFNYLGRNLKQTNCTNDSTRIWYNFETTPINNQIEQEIKNGRFVIRLDYPNKNRVGIHAGEFAEYTGIARYGAGSRSYLHTFPIDERAEYGMTAPLKREILKRSLIFINESDIKVNRYGEKYIHKKISFCDYVKNTCEIMLSSNFERVELTPITNEWLNGEGNTFFTEYLDNELFLGIPTNEPRGVEFKEFYHGTIINKFFVNNRQTGDTSGSKNQTNSIKVNPAFSCYCAFRTTDFGETMIYSPYFINKKFSNGHRFGYRQENSSYYVIGLGKGKRRSRKAYMSARPRCAILNDDYENADYAFLKTFKQSDQQIRLFCKVMKEINDYDVGMIPIFRTIITQK